MEYPKRKHPRLAGYDYSEVGTYFITICAHDKIKLFGEIIVNDEGAENRLTRLGEIAAEQVEELKERYAGLIIDNYVIMPNHVHILMSNYDMEEKKTVSRIIGAFKSRTANLCRESGFNGRLFQTSFYDRIVRNRQEYEKIYRYIEENPLRWNKDMYF